MTVAPTRDSLLGGALTLWQPARGCGYRFNLDPVLLAGFVAPARHVLDLGAGCGVIGLLLLRLGKAERVTAVEIQPELAALATQNAADNGFCHRFHVLEGDLRTVDLPHADAVVFNPPYFRRGDGRVSPEAGRAAGRFESHGTLADFVRSAIRSVSSRGRVSAVVPVGRRREVETECVANGASLRRQRDVCSRVGSRARHLLWEAVRAPGVRTEPPLSESPLVVHGAVGREFSPEVRLLLRE